MHDVRPKAAAEPVELEEAEQVTPRAHRASDVSERDEASAGAGDRLAQRPRTVRGNRELEALGEAARQLGDVGLRASRFRERDDE